MNRLSAGIPELYGGIAEFYEGLIVSKWCRHFNSEWIANHVQELQDLPECRVLDLACGTGLNVKLLCTHRSGIRADGVDISPKMLERALATGNYEKLHTHDLHDPLPGIPSETFDLVIAFAFLEHLSHPLVCLSEASRALKIGGTLWASFKAFEAEDEASPPRRSVNDGFTVTGYSVSHILHMMRSLDLRVTGLDSIVGYFSSGGIACPYYVVRAQKVRAPIHGLTQELLRVP